MQGCTRNPCTCYTSGDLNFSEVTAATITDRILDAMRAELIRLAHELDIMTEIARSNKASYISVVRDLHKEI